MGFGKLFLTQRLNQKTACFNFLKVPPALKRFPKRTPEKKRRHNGETQVKK